MCSQWEVELAVHRSLDCSVPWSLAKSYPGKLFPKDLLRSDSLFREWLFQALLFRAYQDFGESFPVWCRLLAELRFLAAVLRCQPVVSRCFREVLQFQRGAWRCCLAASRYFRGALQLRLGR